MTHSQMSSTAQKRPQHLKLTKSHSKLNLEMFNVLSRKMQHLPLNLFLFTSQWQSLSRRRFRDFLLQKISQKLSDLVNYVHAVHFHDFAHSSAHARYYHMSSFGESKATKIVEENPKLARQFVEYNARQLSRIYPGAKRQDSSNLKPVKFWNAGCQIGETH